MSNWKNQYIELITTCPDYIAPCASNSITTEEIEKVREKAAEFNRVFCEIGSGSGRHLVERAKITPDAMFIGFELRFKRCWKTAEKAEKLGLGNLLVVRTNANFIPDIFTSNSLDGIYINFPDPWSKKRWEKHRTINTEYISKVAQIIKPGGFFSYKTDHREYFESSLKLFREHPDYSVEKETFDLYNSEYLEDNIATEFESLFLSKKLPIHFMKASLTTDKQ